MTLQNVLRKIVLAGAFLAPLVVFIIFNDLFFPFITGKNFAFRAIAEVMFAAWLILAYMSKGFRPRSSAILWTLTAFVGIIFLADMFGANPYKSFWSNYERMEGFVGLVHFFMYFLAASSVLTSEKLWERWFQTSVAASVLMAIYGVFQLLGTFDISQSATRIDGRFGNSAYMAVYLLVHIFLAAFLFIRAKGNAILKYFYCLAILLEVVILFYTQTRGSIVGLFAGGFLMMLLIAIFGKGNALARRLAIGGVVAVVLLVGGFFSMKDVSFVQSNPILKRLADISLTEATVRFMVWDMALSGWKERPLLGWGQENFNFVFNKYYNPGMYSQEQWFDRAHNIFFDWLVAGGLFGLLAYLALFVVLIYYIWRTETAAGNISFFGRVKHWFAHLGHTENGGFRVAEKSVLTGLLTAYFIHNFFVFDNMASYIFFFSFLAYFHHRVLALRESVGESLDAGNTLRSREPLPVLLAVAILLIGGMYFVTVRPYMANAALIKGLQPQSEGLVKNLEYLKKAIGYNTFGTSEAREQLVQTAVRVKELNAPPETASQFFDLAKQEMLLQNERFPGDARYESFTAILFTRFGLIDEAIAHLEIAHELSPNKQAIYLDLIGSYLNKGDKVKALSLAKEAYELEPNFQEAAKVYAVVAVHAGEQKLADEILQKSFGTTVVEDDNLINAYGATKQFAKAVEILELRVKNNPGDPQAHLRLAAGYSEMGQFAKAIAELRKTIELEPQFKEQGEGFIKLLEQGKKP
ncbi:O-antigen ligase family protein [bacterium]|nr:O-antigen ligase family protein [bacterium]